MTGRLGAACRAKNSSGQGSAFNERDVIGWPGAIVLVAMITSACAAPELRTLAASGTGLAGSAIEPTTPQEEPTVLADAELDSITAAGVAVDVASFAAGTGDLALVSTDADTVAMRRRTYDLGLGFTRGLALACCGEEADVEVGSVVAGSGDYVRGVVHAGENDDDTGRRWAYGYSVGFVLALSFRKHWAIDHGEREAIVGELQATYADLRTQLTSAALDFRLSNVR